MKRSEWSQKRYDKLKDDPEYIMEGANLVINDVYPKATILEAEVLRMGAKKHGNNHAFKGRTIRYYIKKVLYHIKQACRDYPVATDNDIHHLSHAICELKITLEKLLIAREESDGTE